MTSCKIVLDNFHGSYYPGNTISGHVVCVFDSSKDFRAIRVRLRGKEHTSWWERESYYDSSSKKTKYRNVHYTGDNTILSFDITLVGESTLSRGRYEYPFTFTLPRDLPTTFDGSYGHIRYYVKANIDIPFAFDYEDERSFTLISLIDFNEIIQQLQLNPVNYEDEKNLCCCCCASDPITMNVEYQKEAFVLGERAKIKVDITNMSNTSLEGLQLQVNMTIESKATSPRTRHKQDTEIVASTSDTGVGAHGQRIYDFDLLIPMSTVLPNFTRSALFKQWCDINVEAVIPGCHSNMEIGASIKLGHIPIGGPSNTLLPQGAIMTSSITDIPGGAFPPHPPAVSADQKPPPYPVGEAAPPYPLGPPGFPTATVPSDIGFKVPGSSGGSSPSLSGKRVPVPVPVHGLYPPGPSAPADQSAPSAPTKAEMAKGGDFAMIDEEDSPEPPPPTYHDALSGPSSPYPPGPPESQNRPPGGQNGPSAPSAPSL
ncbi:unnamed protein product [Phaedon cochleariae]|uniref:Arrestin C-terminal-like domain-containing protein n=1 Tax=Phaedon cochleariae TaxID=80249 RepID=A0A9N9X3Q0_PHACE|nr:unnamed protein product [Phaedon cochleariae]